MTRSLAKELGPRKIRVNSINPGMVETEGVHSAGLAESDFRKQIEAQTPLGRIGQPQDIAPAAVFLASSDSCLDHRRDVLHRRWTYGRLDSRQDLPDRLAVFDLQPLPAGDLEPVGVEPEQVQDRGVDVGDVVPVLDGVEAELVGRAVDDAPLDAAAGHPDREAVVVVVAAVGALRAGSAAELGGPDDDRVVEQAAALEVDQQAGDRLVDLGAEARVVGAEAGVSVPRAGGAVAVEDLDEADAAFGEPAGREHLLAERAGDVVVETVEPAGGFVLVLEAEDLGDGRLHAEGQLVRLDPGAELGVRRVLERGEPVEPAQQVGLDRRLRSARAARPAGRRAAGRPGRP